MDRTTIIVLVVCLGLFLLWGQVVNKLYPPKPLPPGATNAPSTLTATNQPATPNAATSPLTPPRPVVNTNVPEELLVVTNNNSRYTFTSHGGGLKLVELLEYTATTPRVRWERTKTNPVVLNTTNAAPTLALLDGDAVQGDGIFTLSRGSNGVRAEKTLENGLTLVKEFQFDTDFLIAATVRFENHTEHSLPLPPQEWVTGTATPMGPADDGSAVGVMWYNGSKTTDVGASTYFSTHGFMCTPKIAPPEYRGGAHDVVWVAAHNQFFALAVMTATNSPGESLVIRRLDLPRATGEGAKFANTNGPPPQGFQTAIIYPSLTLTQNQTFERHLFIYAGPKEYQTLARLADRFNNNIDQVMAFGWSGFVSKALLLSMNWLHQSLRFSYGWAIVAITVIIKLVFWPLTVSSTRSMKRMQALQPQLTALKEKYKDEPQKFNQKQWEFYKKNKVNPMGSCLPMLLQIPVFFGFLQMIRSAIELRGEPWLWVGDLSQPDTLYMIPGLGFLPFVGVPGVGLPFNLLPLIMGATMLWQARLTPPSPGMDPTQQAIMRYLPLIFLVGLYNFSAGLTLYWTVNNLLTITQTKLTRTTAPAVAPAVAAPPAKAQVLTPSQKKRK
jgi:YidC/Oxa1 family membrane protein insertase